MSTQKILAVVASSLAGSVSLIECSSGSNYGEIHHRDQNETGKKERRGVVKCNSVQPIPCVDGTTILPFVFPSRSEQIKRLKEGTKDKPFDLLVIGGGCVGTGVAMDAAYRGMEVALVESEDFGSGTSSRSTKLVHGGIRYLESAFMNLDLSSFKLVYEALEERAYLLNAAPYIVRPLPIMIPIYSVWQVPYMWIGAQIYNILARDLFCLPPSRWMNKAEALLHFPHLLRDGLYGCVLYYDGQMNDSRLNLTIALTAAQKGAVIANSISVIDLINDDSGHLQGARVHDATSGEKWTVHAKAVVNATGCFSDNIRKMDDASVEPMILMAGGAHIVLPNHCCPESMVSEFLVDGNQRCKIGSEFVMRVPPLQRSQPPAYLLARLMKRVLPSNPITLLKGLIIPKTEDGRVLFFLPWEGSTLVGTTDSETELTMMPRPKEEDVAFLTRECNRYIDIGVLRKDVRASWSGIRPLVRFDSYKGRTADVSRSHVIEVSPSGLVTVMGGKWTTFRRMAEDTVDTVLRSIPKMNEHGAISGKSLTASLGLVGSDRRGIVCDGEFVMLSFIIRKKYNFPVDIADHLVKNYGTRSLQIAEIVKRNPVYSTRDGAPLRLVQNEPFLEAEVVFAVDQEYAVTAVDIMARRLGLAFIDATAARAASQRVVEIMAKHLDWSYSRQTSELSKLYAFIDTCSV